MFRVPAVFVLLMVQGAVGASAEESPVQVHSRVTWLTALGPEVHLLLENASQENLTFSVRFARDGERAIECAGPVRSIRALDPLQTRDGNYARTFLEWHRFHSTGTLPAGGWAHRSFPVFIDPGSLPCRVPFHLMIDPPFHVDRRGWIEIQEGPPSRFPVFTRKENVAVKSLVEDDRWDPRAPTVRILIRNEGDDPIRVEASGRGVECEMGAHAGWAALRGVLQGENTGPIDIPAGGWGVLVDVVRAEKREDLQRCRGWVRLQGSTTQGAVDLGRTEFSLEPTGTLGRLFMHD